MYVDSNIPSGYKYIYEVSSNYIALTDTGSVESGDQLDCYYQYLEPSWLVVHANTVASADLRLSQIQDVSTSDYARADFPEIFASSMILLFFILWIMNGLTKLVHKGGVFFGL